MLIVIENVRSAAVRIADEVRTINNVLVCPAFVSVAFGPLCCLSLLPAFVAVTRDLACGSRRKFRFDSCSDNEFCACVCEHALPNTFAICLFLEWNLKLNFRG